jgi:CRP-like cAMP-binding protein
MEREEVKKVLKEKFLFLEKCSSETIEGIISNGALKNIPRRRKIYSQGTKGESLYFLLKGVVRLSRIIKNGKEIIVGYRKEGEIFGEELFYGQGAYEDTSEAALDVTILSLPYSYLENLMKEDSYLALRLFQLQGQRYSQLKTRIEGFVKGVERRLAGFLVIATEHFGEEHPAGKKLRVKFTHKEISNIIGSTRETVTVSLGRLRDKKIIDLERRWIIIRELEKLKELM